jgi:1-acyl-sn-glycerol-3-phosphate acyltransferase
MRLSQTIIGFLGVVGGNAILATVIFVVALVDRSGVVWWPLARLWGLVMMRSVGTRLRIEHPERLAGLRCAVLMANHESMLDVPALIHASASPVRFVSKHTLFRVPVFGQAMWATGMIPVDRSDRRRAIASLARAASEIRNGKVVLVFPEGTRSKDGELGGFKKGGFMLALDAQVPIIPIGISGTFPVLPKGLGLVNPGPIAMVVGEPIPTAGLDITSRTALMEKVSQAILAARKQAQLSLSSSNRI